MGRYSQLATITIAHEFFSGGPGLSLRFEPTAETEPFFRRTGLLFRPSTSSFSIALDDDWRDALKLTLAGHKNPLFLTFKAFSTDPEFHSYTEPVPRRPTSVLVFETPARKPAAGRPILLHKGEFADESSFQELADLRVAGVLEERDVTVRPEFLCRIGLAPADFKAAEFPNRDYRIQLKSKQTIWKYFFLGLPKRGSPGITDLANGTEFEFCGQALLPGDRTALAFRSKTPIPLKRQHDVRFQLRDNSVSGGKVLIRRLPVASAGQVGKDVIDGREAIVSEIYINC